MEATHMISLLHYMTAAWVQKNIIADGGLIYWTRYCSNLYSAVSRDCIYTAAVLHAWMLHCCTVVALLQMLQCSALLQCCMRCCFIFASLYSSYLCYQILLDMHKWSKFPCWLSVVALNPSLPFQCFVDKSGAHIWRRHALLLYVYWEQ